MSQTHEQRILERRPCSLNLEVTASDWTGLEEVQAVDLSLVGVGLKARSPFQVIRQGTSVELHAVGKTPVLGVVRWAKNNRSGVQFSHQWDEVLESWVGETLSALKSGPPCPTPVSLGQTEHKPLPDDCEATLYS